MAGTSGTINESSSQLQATKDDTVYIAVGKNVNKSKLTLLWAFQNFRGNKFCILHVHQLAKATNLVGGNSPATRLEEREIWASQRLERKTVQMILDNYILICHQAGVYAEKLYIEMDDIGEGILELVDQHSIKKLVMGAAADKHSTEVMSCIKSRKAIYVKEHLLIFCQIWFICGGHLIQSWKGGEIIIFGEECTISISETRLLNLNRSPSGSNNFTGSSSGVDDNLAFSAVARMERNECDLEACDDSSDLHYLPASGVLEGTSDNQLLDQLEQSLVEVENLKREAFEESVRRVKAEKTTIEALRKARALEMSYIEELKRMKEIEELLAKQKHNLENMKKQLEEERLIALDQRVLLESQVASFDYMMKELDDKRLSAVEMSQVYKKERDEFQVECNNALNVTEELLQKQSEATSSIYSVFSLSEIHEASCNFDPSLKIKEQGYRTVYKGLLYSTPVAIKVLNHHSSQSLSEFQQEVGVMSEIRHPNLISLIGACPEACALVYEYLPNGNLQDRLSCKDNSPPLSWQTRIRIATEICSVLIFLHSRKPQNLVYGDLKAENILLDANFVCKLGDFRIPHHPGFLEMEEVSPRSDIYLFGIILLQLLTGRSPLNIVKEMQDVLHEGTLEGLLDLTAGDWPFVQATQLAHLALRCCDIDPSNRPDLVADVWRVLVPMRATCGASSSFWLGSEESRQPPSYFICPILQEVMQNPHVAADGFTYEKEALMGWLESDHDTSPMTNIRLTHHELLPNHALRSAIQEWLQQH